MSYLGIPFTEEICMLRVLCQCCEGEMYVTVSREQPRSEVEGEIRNTAAAMAWEEMEPDHFRCKLCSEKRR